jgi:hypothetical protein
MFAALPIAVERSETTQSSDFETTGGTRWLGECSGYNAKGEITGAKGVSLTTELSGCGFRESGEKCNSKGAKEGHIVTPENGTLVYINKSTKQVGVLFTLTEVHAECGSVKETLRGSVVVPIAAINTKTSKIGMTFHQSSGKQEFITYENEKSEKKTAYLELNFGSGFEQTGFAVEGTPELTTSKPVTIEG